MIQDALALAYFKIAIGNNKIYSGCSLRHNQTNLEIDRRGKALNLLQNHTEFLLYPLYLKLKRASEEFNQGN